MPRDEIKAAAARGTIRSWLGSPVAIVLLFLAIHLVAAAVIDLGFDETYYWYWSRYPSASYYDHPPMVAWWIWLGTTIFGDNSFGVRVIGTLALVPISAAIYATGAILFDRRVGALAAIWLNATLLFGIGGMLASPDAPSVLFWTLAMFALALLMRSGDGRWWVAVGASAGLGVISKLTNLFFGPGLVLAALAFASLRTWLSRAWLWLGAAIAVAVVAPMLLWNADHDFVTLTKQFGRIGKPGLRLSGLLEYALTQFLLLNPAVAVLAGFAAVLWLTRRPRNAPLGILFATVLPMILFLAVSATRQRIQGNWPAPIYPTIALIAAAAAERIAEARHGGRLLAWYRDSALPFGLALAVIGTLVLVNPGNLIPARQDVGRAFRGWSELAAAVEQARTEAGAAWIATTYYNITGEMVFHLRDRNVPVVEVTERERYVFAPPPDPALLQQPALIVTNIRNAAALAACFASVTPMKPVLRATGAGTYATYYTYKASGPQPDLFAKGCSPGG